MSQLTYRQATREELDLAVSWAAEEGWNPGLRDADIFWETDPEGFVCVEREGEVIGTGSVVNYDQAFGFMGFFIVRPDLRGQGIGRDFWYWRRDLLKERLAEGAAIGMDGVFDMQPFYAKGGFAFSHRNLRMEGVGMPHAIHNQELIALDELPYEQVLAFDRQHFGFAREAFLRAWIMPKRGTGLGVVREGQLVGMGVIRPCLNGFKIGPLFATEATVADTLFRALSNEAIGEPIFFDIPENNPCAFELSKRHELSEVFGCARMYYGAAPDLPWQQIYGITTFELG